MSKLQELKVGQTVWLELFSILGSEGKREVSEYHIVEANKSSAYAIRKEDVGKYKSGDNQIVRKRILQKTHKVVEHSFGYDYVVWLSEREFQKNIEYNVKYSDSKKKALELINEMNLEELELFLENYSKQ